jgi:diguanylate cyclase (GGDEF)-like protein
MTSVHQYLTGRSPSIVVTIALGMGLLVGVLERVSAAGPALRVLDLLPVAFAAVYAGWRWGAVLAVLALLLPGAGALAGGEAEIAVRLALLLGAGLALGAARVERGSGEGALPGIDESTGLANSKALFNLITMEVERAQRYGRSFTVAYIGIDNLPTVRQRVGNQAVEDVLRRVAHQINGSLRSVDVVARLRDREFALLLPETGVDAARTVLGRVQRLLNVSLAEEDFPLSFTIGAVTWIRSASRVEALHQRTYQLMYAARKDGLQVRHEILQDEVVEEVPHRYLVLRH